MTPNQKVPTGTTLTPLDDTCFCGLLFSQHRESTGHGPIAPSVLVGDPAIDHIRADILLRLLGHEMLVHGVPVVTSGVLRSYLARFAPPRPGEPEPGTTLTPGSASHPQDTTSPGYDPRVAMLQCALAWEPEARLIGNVTALDVAKVAALTMTTCPACGSEAWVNIDCGVCSAVAPLLKDPEGSLSPTQLARKAEINARLVEIRELVAAGADSRRFWDERRGYKAELEQMEECE